MKLRVWHVLAALVAASTVLGYLGWQVARLLVQIFGPLG